MWCVYDMYETKPNEMKVEDVQRECVCDYNMQSMQWNQKWHEQRINHFRGDIRMKNIDESSRGQLRSLKDLKWRWRFILRPNSLLYTKSQRYIEELL